MIIHGDQFHLIPDEAEGVYIIFNEDNNIIYIGMSGNLKLRLNSKRLIEYFLKHKFLCAMILFTFSKRHRFKLERDLIIFFNPPLNTNRYQSGYYYWYA